MLKGKSDLWAIPVKKQWPGIPLKKKWSDWRTRLLAALQEYCNISTLHGLRNIAADGISLLERLVWVAIVMVCTGLTVSMMASVWQRYRNVPIITTIETNHYPVHKIPFPAVTVCNTNVILLSSALIMINKFESVGVPPEVSRKFLENLPQSFKGTRPMVLDDLSGILRAMKRLNYTLETLMAELSQPCAHLFTKCNWKGVRYNCTDMFVHLSTSDGYCCSFNWHGKVTEFQRDLKIRQSMNVSRWRKRGDFTEKLFVGDAGTTTSGLSVIVNSEIENYFASINSFLGAAVIIHDPDKYPDVTAPRIYVQPQFETNVRITAHVVESDDNVRSIKPHQRQCRFDDEIGNDNKSAYSYETCVLDCRMKTYAERCRCIPFFYPKYYNSSVTPACDLSDWNCLHKNKAILSSQDFNDDDDEDQMPCDCLPSCSDVGYEFEAYGNKIYSPQHASLDFGRDLGNKSLFNVYFQDNVCIKYKRASTINFETIMASLGGIFGLWLGGSVMSIIELVYFITVKIWKYKKPKEPRYPDSTPPIFVRTKF